jgi:hypothetical protein
VAGAYHGDVVRLHRFILEAKASVS